MAGPAAQRSRTQSSPRGESGGPAHPGGIDLPPAPRRTRLSSKQNTLDRLPELQRHTASPFQKFGRDILCISLVITGLSSLLSLEYGGESIHLGTLLRACFGWGAPALGIALIALGILIALGPGRMNSLEIRFGVIILFTGFLSVSGLTGIDAALHGGHGGDVGSAFVAGLHFILVPIVGAGAWYVCAHLVVAGLNLVGFLMVTGKPLAHWTRAAGSLARAAHAKSAARADARAWRAAAQDPLSENARTRRSRSKPAGVPSSSTRAPVPTLDGPLSTPSEHPPHSPIRGLGNLRTTGDQPESKQDTSVPHSGDGAALDAILLQHTKPGERIRKSFAAALDTLLPPPTVPSSRSRISDPAASEDGETTVHVNAPADLVPLLARGIPLEELLTQPGGINHSPAEPSAPASRSKRKEEGSDPAPEDDLLSERERNEPTARLGEDEPCGDPGSNPNPGTDISAASRERRGRKPARSNSDSIQLPLEFPDSPTPPAGLLSTTPPPPRKTEEEANATVSTLEMTLQSFKVEARVVEIAEGPTLTRYEIQLAPGILVKKIVSLADNIAMALAAIDVRVEAPIPGKSAIGVEIPKRVSGLVGLRELVDAPEFRRAPLLTFALGRDVTGAPQYADLARMPHLLIAGSTGSGKSACLNTLITSLLYRAQPEELQFVMIDPKRVELSLYDGIPHLCHQIVRDSKRAPQALGKVMAEMDRRYLLLQHARTRDIAGYNNKAETPEQRLPYIVVVIDELADLMMTSGAETEHAIIRVAQLARAVGIHLVVATQRPSVDIVTGKIKANISSRIAFAVSSGIDSRTILDCTGAERLIGRGDMLFLPIDANKPRRIQGAYINEAELEKVVEFWRSKGSPDYYLERVTLPDADLQPVGDADDELYSEAVRVVLSAGQASTSMIQRRLKIGYNRAASLIELMEENGVVGPQDGVRPREVMISSDQWDLMHSN